MNICHFERYFLVVAFHHIRLLLKIKKSICTKMLLASIR
jgi:hypothetical protein